MARNSISELAPVTRTIIVAESSNYTSASIRQKITAAILAQANTQPELALSLLS